MSTTIKPKPVRLDLPPKLRTVRSLMSDAEHALYRKPPSLWGDARDAVMRGAQLLDREMPGWQERVEINELDLSSSCSCVLGQVFASYATNLSEQSSNVWEDPRPVIDAGGKRIGRLDHLAVDGFSFAQYYLGFSKARQASPEAFFGFDHSEEYSYGELTTAWRELLEDRKHMGATS